jgi:hypothetical protein
MSEQKPTPLPWRHHYGVIYAEDVEVAEIFRLDEPSRPTEERPTRADCEAEEQANAEFIVRACNAHDDLVKAALTAQTYLRLQEHLRPLSLGERGMLEDLDAALAKATGQEVPHVS